MKRTSYFRRFPKIYEVKRFPFSDFLTQLQGGIFHSLFVTRYFLLVTRCSLSFYSLHFYSLFVELLLVTRCIFTRYSLHFYSLVVAFLLVTRCVLLVTPCTFTRYSLHFYSLLIGFVLAICCALLFTLLLVIRWVFICHEIFA